jgi:PhnB protein
MTKRAAPYINFQGKAREAMEFYHGIFGGELELYAADEQGKPRRAERGERIMYARLSGDGVLLIASDGHPKFPTTLGDGMAISLIGTDREALGKAFDRLAEGGQAKMPLRDTPWGGAAGWLKDRFGINWNVDVEKG